MVGVHGSLCSGTLRRHYGKAGYGLRRGEVTLAFFPLPVLFEEGLYRRLKCVCVCVCVCVSEEGKKVFLKKVYRRFEVCVCVYVCVSRSIFHIHPVWRRTTSQTRRPLPPPRSQTSAACVELYGVRAL